MSTLDKSTANGHPVSTAQVAKALNVSVTTVKRWVDGGIIPAHRTAGGHRKVLMADVFRMARECNLPLAEVDAVIPPAFAVEAETPESSPLRDEFTMALLRGDATVVDSLLHAAYRNGYTIADLADRIIAPGMAEIGRLWEVGEVGILTEHRATQAVAAALYRLQGLLLDRRDGPRPVAIGGAPEYDHSILPTLLARLVLIEAGWSAVNIGPHTPFVALHDALREYRPGLVWLSVSYVADPPGFEAEYRSFYGACREANALLAIGGRALLNPHWSRPLPSDLTGRRFAELADFARRLHRPPGVPKRGRPVTGTA